GLLRHHADLLRQRGAAPRSRLHDDRRRRDGAPHAPAGGGGLLPHRHRRARRAGRPGRRARGHHAGRAGRSQRAALPGPHAARERVQRLLHPHQRPAAQAARAGGDAARPRQRPRLQGRLRGLVLPPLRGLQDRSGDRRRQHLPDPPDPAGARERGELVLPALDLPGAAGAALRRPGRLRPTAPARQRGARLH
ncbi:MAG: Methionyl-tRNA synthetase, partial [uncultured Solirubrobacteraceae bacterium]